MVSFENLTIKRLIAHEVVLASSLDFPGAAPLMSEDLTPLDGQGQSLVSRRVADSLGTNSHSIEVAIERDGPDSVFACATSLLSADDATFIAGSKDLALRLSKAQTIGSIKPGIAVVIEATIGPDSEKKRAVIIVKAESDTGFVKQVKEGLLTLQYVRDIVLGAQQRLIKIGAFIEVSQPSDPTGNPRSKADFTAVVFDHGLNIKEMGVAARYFYSTYLGATMAPSSPALNRVFFDVTNEFINDSDRSREEKWELRSALVSYFRNQEATISPKIFGDRHFPDDAECLDYVRCIRKAGFPTRAVEKNTAFIKDRLKRRLLRFSNQVLLTAPSDVFRQAITIIDDTKENEVTLKISGKIIDDR